MKIVSVAGSLALSSSLPFTSLFCGRYHSLLEIAFVLGDATEYEICKLTTSEILHRVFVIEKMWPECTYIEK